MVQDNEEEFEEEVVESAPQVHDYSERYVLIWEPDDDRRRVTLEAISDLLIGASVKAVRTEEEALESLNSGEFDTFVVDFYTDGVSSSDFIKAVNNTPDAILVALSMASFSLEETNRSKQEPLRRLFDVDKASQKPLENPEA
ncbi:MAG: hypothetical protein LBR60_05560 [Fibrobacter sp.]|jgi:DNA-binding NtrC family response regulator|nr:hypothetical protein [Fibrobacter sp.]